MATIQSYSQSATTTSSTPMQQPRRVSESSVRRRTIPSFSNQREQRLLVESTFPKATYSARPHRSEQWGAWRPPGDHLNITQLRSLDQLHPFRPEECANGNIGFLFRLLNISNMDEESQTVEVELECVTHWVPILPEFWVPGHGKFERVIIPEDSRTKFKKLIRECHELLWSGQLHIADAEGTWERNHQYSVWNQDPTISTPGKSVPIVRLHQRFKGTVNYVPRISRFPFDNPTIDLRFRAKRWNIETWKFIPLSDELKDEIEAESKKSVDGLKAWNFLGCSFDHTTQRLGTRITSYDATEFYEMMTISLHFRRKWSYWINKYFIPLDLIVLSSWAPFFVQSTSSTDQLLQIAVVFLAILTLVAHIIAFSSTVPKLYVTTLIDRHYLVCFLILFLTLAAISDVPHSLWSGLEGRLPHSVVAKLAIVFGSWHVAIIGWLVIMPWATRVKEEFEEARRQSVVVNKTGGVVAGKSA